MVGVGVAEGNGGGGGPGDVYYGEYYTSEQFYGPQEMCLHPQHPQHMCTLHNEYVPGGMPVLTSGTVMPQLMPPVMDDNMRHYLVTHSHAQAHPHHPPHHQPPHHQPPHHQPPPHHQQPHHYSKPAYPAAQTQPEVRQRPRGGAQSGAAQGEWRRQRPAQAQRGTPSTTAHAPPPHRSPPHAVPSQSYKF